MSLRLAEILTDHWASYVQQNRSSLTAAQYRAARAVLLCRTSAMGGRVYRCECGKDHYAYHSCNNRSCPQCGGAGQQAWSMKQEARLLPGVTYFMITFTVPAELRSVFLTCPKEGYNALLKASADALKDVIGTKHGGAEIGFTSVLHTWGRQIQHHPHVHMIVPGVAYDPATCEAVSPSKNGSFLVHYKPLAARFRTLMRDALLEIEELTLNKDALRALSPSKQWNVQVKDVGKGQNAVRYLAKYAMKSAFSEERLLGYDARGNLRIKWTCSTTGKVSVLTLTVMEFIRRWLLHVLPKGFARIRHYGFMSAAGIKKRLRLRALLGEIGEPTVELPSLPPMCCEDCGGELKLIRILKAPRPPPHSTEWKI